MIFKIYSNFIQLNQILSTLQTRKEKAYEGEFQKAISKIEFQKIISKIGNQIKDLEENSKRGFTSLTEKLRIDIVQVLKALNQELKNHSKQTELIQDITKKILCVQACIENAPLHQEKISIKPKIGLKIGFFCDIDSREHNGAIMKKLQIAIKQNLPFITTRSMLRGSEIEDNHIMLLEAEEIEKQLLENHSSWEIFQQFDSEYGEELVVFLPTSLLPEKSGKDKLEALDFVIDGSLKKVSLKDVMQGSQRKTNISAFFKLFTDEPKLNKIFYFAGHGDINYVGGLAAENYQKFLSFIEKQKCKSLIVFSCYSGGKSSLLNIPAKQQNSEKIPSFEDQVKEHSIYTIVQSIGDFPTFSGLEAENDLNLLFGEVASILENPGLETLPRFRQMFEKIEKNKKEKSERNLIKIYCPHSSGTHSGFRPLDENGRGCSITYAIAKGNELRSKLRFTQNTSEAIHIKNKSYLEIHPLVTQIPIIFEEKNPLLLSMIPGNGHHFLKSIKLACETPLDFIKAMRENHSVMNLGAKKGFFIGQIISENTTFEKVALRITPEGAHGVYRHETNYYFMDEGAIKAITPLQYVLICENIEALTRGNELSISTVSGGQESEALFQDALNEHFFSPDIKASKAFLSLLEMSIKNHPSEVVLNVINARGLTLEEKQSLLFWMLKKGYHKLALDMFKNENMKPNIYDVDASPLICYAIRYNHQDMVKCLLELEVGLNVKDPLDSYNSPLHQVVKLGDQKLVECLLKNPSIQTEIKNLKGRTPLYFAVLNRNSEIFKMLLAKGACLDSSQGRNLLSFFVLTDEPEHVDFLLQANPNPNIGNPSALIQAIRSNNIYMVRRLMQAGGKPFEKDQNGSVPFVQAALRASFEIFNLFLERDDCDLQIQEKDGVSPLIAALFSGNTEKIDALKKKKVTFPKILTPQANLLLQNVIKRYLKLNDRKLIEQLLLWHSSYFKEFEYLVASYCLEISPEYLEKLINLDYINPNSENIGSESIFVLICQKAANNLKYEMLIKACLAKGDVNYGKSWFKKPLEIALEAKDPKLLKTLLENGADLLKTRNPLASFFNIIDFDDLDLVKLACKTEFLKATPGVISALQHAAEGLKPDSNGTIFKWLIEQGADINALGIGNRNPFCRVISSGNLPLVNYCLEHGAVIAPKDKNIDPPMEVAAFAVLENDPEGKIFKKLIEAGGDLNSQTIWMTTPFAGLAKSGSLDLIEWALKMGAEVNPKNPDRRPTPLECAASHKNDPQGIVFKRLLAAGADINAPGLIGQHPVQAVIKHGNIDLLRFCFANGARIDSQTMQYDCLLEAILSGDTEKFQLLLDKNFKITSEILSKGLFEGYKAGGEKMLKKLLEQNIHVNSDDIKSWDKIDLVKLLTKNNDIESTKLLFEHKVLPFVSDIYNGADAVLYHALTERKLDFLILLDQFQIPFNFKFLNYHLHIKGLVENENVDILRFLFTHGLDPNKKFDFSTILEGSFEPPLKKKVIRLLLELKVDPNQKIKFLFPLYIAVLEGDFEVVKMLVDAGADISKKDALTKITALKLAEIKGHKEIINLLKKNVGRSDPPPSSM